MSNTKSFVDIMFERFEDFQSIIVPLFIKYISLPALGLLVIKTLIAIDEKKATFMNTLISFISALFFTYHAKELCEKLEMSELIEFIIIISVCLFSDRITRSLLTKIDIELYVGIIIETSILSLKDLIISFFEGVKAKFKSKSKK